MNTSRAQRIVNNTGILYLRMVLMLIVSLYTTRIVLNTLGFDDYGLYTVIGGVVALAGFISSSLDTTTQRFLAFEIGGEDGVFKQVFRASLSIHLLIGLVVLVTGEVFGMWFIEKYINYDPSRKQAIVWVLHFSIASYVLSVIRIPFSSVLIAHEKMNIFAGLGVAESLLKLVIALALNFFNSDLLIVYSALLFVLTLLSVLAFSIACKPYFNWSDMAPTWCQELIKKQIRHTGWNLIGSLAGVLSTHGTNLLLNIFFGPVVNAARAIALQVHAAVTQFTVNLQTSVTPQITKSYASKDMDYFNRLIFTGTKLYAALISIVCIPIFFEINYLLSIWLGETPRYTAIFTQLTLASIYTGTFSTTLQAAVQATGQVKQYQLIIGGLFLFLLPVIWIVLHAGYPPYSVLWVSIFFNVLMLLMRIWILKGLISLQATKFILDPVLKSIISTLPAVFIAILIQQNLPPSLIRAIVTLCTCSTSTIVCFYVFTLRNDEKRFINGIVRTVLSRIIRKSISS